MKHQNVFYDHVKKIKDNLLCCLAIITLATSTACSQNGPTLKIGDSAPPIVVEKWVKGEPVNLKDGKVHVIEFWATYCGPCKFGMPHVSKLAQRYRGKVVFTGISIWEHTQDYLSDVEDFVKHAHESMDYNVAAGGGKDAIMGNTYMKAVGAGGIPYSFVIDRQGKVAWHGFPLNGLDEALEFAVKDELTLARVEQLKKRQEELSKKGREWRTIFLEARESGDDKTMLKFADKIVYNLPHMGGMVIPYQYIAYANTDTQAAKVFGQKLLNEYYNAPMLLTSVAGKIVDEKSRILGERDYALAVKLLRQAEKMMKAGVSLKEQLAKALFYIGDVKNAIEEQKLALALAEENLSFAEQSSESDNNQQIVDRARNTVKSIQAVLVEYIKFQEQTSSKGKSTIK
jgi:Thiol-disulfide isomerase and thioredoxins